MKFGFFVALALSWLVSAQTSSAAEISPFTGALETVENAQEYKIHVMNKDSEKTWTIADLEQLPLVKANLKTRWKVDGDFVGVRQSSLLEYSGIKSFKRLMIKASDGFQAALGGGEDDLSQVILATRINGKAFKLTDKGPFFMVWPSHAQRVLKGELAASKWVWSIVEIKKTR